VQKRNRQIYFLVEQQPSIVDELMKTREVINNWRGKEGERHGRLGNVDYLNRFAFHYVAFSSSWVLKRYSDSYEKG